MGDAVRVNGKVKWFNCIKGYGFISRDNGDDVFVHASMIDRPNPHKFGQSLDQDEDVQFEIIQDDVGRLQAGKVTGADGECVRGSRYAYRVVPPHATFSGRRGGYRLSTTAYHQLAHPHVGYRQFFPTNGARASATVADNARRLRAFSDPGEGHDDVVVVGGASQKRPFLRRGGLVRGVGYSYNSQRVSFLPRYSKPNATAATALAGSRRYDMTNSVRRGRRFGRGGVARQGVGRTDSKSCPESGEQQEKTADDDGKQTNDTTQEHRLSGRRTRVVGRRHDTGRRPKTDEEETKKDGDTVLLCDDTKAVHAADDDLEKKSLLKKVHGNPRQPRRPGALPSGGRSAEARTTKEDEYNTSRRRRNRQTGVSNQTGNHVGRRISDSAEDDVILSKEGELEGKGRERRGGMVAKGRQRTHSKKQQITIATLHIGCVHKEEREVCGGSTDDEYVSAASEDEHDLLESSTVTLPDFVGVVENASLE